MRRQQSVAAMVYHHLYPCPGPQDPPDFSQYLIRHLITEVRIETQRFYGGLDTIEAKYPGLNYSHLPHRKRLGRFSNHARLFQAFDELGLTAYEISELCKWEGTLWARQRYERDEKITVKDTTATEIKHYVEKRPEFTSRKSPRTISRSPSRQREVMDLVDRTGETYSKEQLRPCRNTTYWSTSTASRQTSTNLFSYNRHPYYPHSFRRSHVSRNSYSSNRAVQQPLAVTRKFEHSAMETADTQMPDVILESPVSPTPSLDSGSSSSPPESTFDDSSEEEALDSINAEEICIYDSTGDPFSNMHVDQGGQSKDLEVAQLPIVNNSQAIGVR